MSYEDVVIGLHERFLTIPNLAVGDGEPTAVQAFPYMYSILDRFERTNHGGVVAMRYWTIHRLCVQWQDTAIAEAQIRQYVNQVPASVDADPHLGNRIRSGIAIVELGESGWIVIDGNKLRIIDFISNVLEKGATRGGL